jgi:putative phosphoesterase
MQRIGLISDTHNLLRPQALAFLRGCDHIVHAGDIMGADVLEELSSIAPVTAVRGNNDHGPWAEALNEVETLQIEGVSLLVLHDLHDLNRLAPQRDGVRVIITGHSHKPAVEERGERGEVLFVNPGSAGPRRFTLPVSVGELTISGERVSARTVTLNVPR